MAVIADNKNELLSGIVERVTFHNQENGFCVLRVKVKGHRDLVTVTGATPSISPGEYIQSGGFWHNDRNHGLQFRASFLKAMPPNTLEGIEKYLASGLIKGIGGYFAKKLVAAFGEEVFEVIETRPHLLSTIEGIGKIRAASICNNWQSQKIVREIMVFLQSHGVGTTRATRIYKTYGNKAIEIVSENPYRLAKDITGIGFVSADKIAANLGIARDSLIRAQAGVNYVLLEATSNGHCGLPISTIIQDTTKLLEVEEGLIKAAIDEEIKPGFLTRNNINGVEAVFLSSYYVYEKYIAGTLLSLSKGEVESGQINATGAINWVEGKLGIQLASAQKLAVTEALKHKVTVITGGPGTGKTTLIRSILTVLKTGQLSVKLCAPTGRAAKRLSESTGLEAVTIHRLLEIDPIARKFKYNEGNKLKCDYLVIDEASMVDVPLFYSLLRALSPDAALLITGDVDQLPSVGAGQVLKDIIDSNAIKTVRLTEIYRQEKTGNIIKNAYLVNKGIFPDITHSHKKSDFYFINAEQGDDIIKKIITLVKERIPNRFGFNPINDIQVLSPMQRGGVGVRSLNIELQKALNPNYSLGIEKYGQAFAAHDKVMQTENNYDKEVYNGDIGIIKNINRDEQEVTISFYNREIKYDYTDLDQITLAYATTIHKSQGSEYPAVVIPLTMQSFTMLKRNLIYTAITRGKNLVIIIGQKKALAIAVKDNKGLIRYTKLREWLCNDIAG